MPDEIVDVVRLGRMTASPMAVFGALLRSRHPKQWSRPRSLSNTYALSTKTGGECIAHSLQALIDVDPRTTLLSIDGIGAFDLISRGAMLDDLRSVAGGDSVLPSVVQFYGNPSSYLWDDDDGETHKIRQGEESRRS